MFFTKERRIDEEAEAGQAKRSINNYKTQPLSEDIIYLDERSNRRNSPRNTANNRNNHNNLSKNISAPKEKRRVSAFSGPERDTLCRLCGSYYTKKGLANHQIACAKRLLNKSQ